MSKGIDKTSDFGVDCTASPEQISLAMDCVGWLSLHGYLMTFHEEGLCIEPEDVPDYILERLATVGSAFTALFPNHKNEVGRVLGGKI